MARVRLGGILVMAVVVTAGIASFGYAGQKWHYDVVVGTTSTGVPMAGGATGNARNGGPPAANTGDYIGCKVIGTAGGNPDTNVMVWCMALGQNVPLACWSSDGGIVKAAAALDSNSYIQFTVAADGHSCASLQVENYSAYLPPAP